MSSTGFGLALLSVLALVAVYIAYQAFHSLKRRHDPASALPDAIGLPTVRPSVPTALSGISVTSTRAVEGSHRADFDPNSPPYSA